MIEDMATQVVKKVGLGPRPVAQQNLGPATFQLTESLEKIIPRVAQEE
jgi:hypothetical protein